VPAQPGVRRRRRAGPSPSSTSTARRSCITLIDLPFAVSPVVSGPHLRASLRRQRLRSAPGSPRNDIKILFAVPGIVLATIFITFPFVARELIPLMQTAGQWQEEAAVLAGRGRLAAPSAASRCRTSKWGLLYGVLLCNARAMGEFGAVSVVSGHIRGQTNTLPLHIEILYHEYKAAAAFAVASLLALLALVTLVAKTLLEARCANSLAAQRQLEFIDVCRSEPKTSASGSPAWRRSTT